MSEIPYILQFSFLFCYRGIFQNSNSYIRFKRSFSTEICYILTDGFKDSLNIIFRWTFSNIAATRLRTQTPWYCTSSSPQSATSILFTKYAGRKRIVTQELNSNFNEPIITNLARAFCRQALIDSGKFSNVHELAGAIGKDDGYISRIIRLTLLSPEIIHAIIAGTLEKDIGIEQLKQAMPLMWDDQKKMFGME